MLASAPSQTRSGHVKDPRICRGEYKDHDNAIPIVRPSKSLIDSLNIRDPQLFCGMSSRVYPTQSTEHHE